MMPLMDKTNRALLFDEARTHRAWLEKPVSDQILRELYDLLRMPPTSANCQPARIVFVKSAAAKEKLKPALSPTNVEKTMKAPVTAIVAYDTTFYEKMSKLSSPQMADNFRNMPAERRDRLAFQSSTLQGAYLILAARGLGLDCGPMGGFDNEAVDKAFFPDGKWRSNFLVNLGCGDATKLHPRQPRLDFEEACRIE
jgi:3-hydroxypropanoate dehydrogenase